MFRRFRLDWSRSVCAYRKIAVLRTYRTWSVRRRRRTTRVIASTTCLTSDTCPVRTRCGRTVNSICCCKLRYYHDWIDGALWIFLASSFNKACNNTGTFNDRCSYDPGLSLDWSALWRSSGRDTKCCWSAEKPGNWGKSKSTRATTTRAIQKLNSLWTRCTQWKK